MTDPTALEILVIEDDLAICRLLEIALEANGYKTSFVPTAREAKITTAMRQPALVLLDLGLPDADGQDLLKALREWYIRPVIVVSARDSEAEIIKALDNGANDYLTKPFRTGELLARIRAALRQDQPEAADPVKTYGDLIIDLAARVVRKNGEMVKLTSTEYALLALFVRNEGKVLTHQFILREVWGPGYVERTEYPRVFVGQLRKKIETDPNYPKLISTESGVGYRFEAE
ncbi:MAG: response regulator [Saprospiraceae bacterium]|nr:response regulator [Saprospiraceae bacterium]